MSKTLKTFCAFLLFFTLFTFMNSCKNEDNSTAHLSDEFEYRDHQPKAKSVKPENFEEIKRNLEAKLQKQYNRALTDCISWEGGEGCTTLVDVVIPGVEGIAESGSCEIDIIYTVIVCGTYVALTDVKFQFGTGCSSLQSTMNTLYTANPSAYHNYYSYRMRNIYLYLISYLEALYIAPYPEQEGGILDISTPSCIAYCSTDPTSRVACNNDCCTRVNYYGFEDDELIKLDEPYMYSPSSCVDTGCPGDKTCVLNCNSLPNYWYDWPL